MSHGHVSPTDKLNLAAVGIGGMGHANINHVRALKILWLFVMWIGSMQKVCSTNSPRLKILDYRKMYDEMGKSIDGVIVATADHTHAIIMLMQ